jgi:hypothetical protein
MAKIPLIVPVSYLWKGNSQWGFTIETNRKDNKTYPKSTPPKATNRPIIMAGAAEPTASSGFFNAKPIAKRLSETRYLNRSKISGSRKEVIVLGEVLHCRHTQMVNRKTTSEKRINEYRQ